MTHCPHTIKTCCQLRDYLAYTDNAYTRFINEKLKKLRRPLHPLQLKKPLSESRGQSLALLPGSKSRRATTFTQGYELHHIIPRHAYGCDESWNLIPLTYVDHQVAHELLYETYGLAQDRCALNFRKGRRTVGLTLRAKLGHDAQRWASLGFFDPNQQRKYGQKGGKIQTDRKLRAYSRKCVDAWGTLLAKPVIWLYEPSRTTIFIPARCCILPRDVSRRLLSHEPFKHVYHAKAQSLTGALTRVIRGQRQRACGWRFLGSPQTMEHGADSQPNNQSRLPPA